MLQLQIIKWKYKCWIKSNGNSLIFSHGFIQRNTTFITFNIVAPLFITFYEMFGRRRTPSAPTSLLMFRIERPISRTSSSIVLYRVTHSSSFTLAKRSNRMDSSGEYGVCSTISHCRRRKRSVPAASLWLFALSWRMMGFCTTKCRRFFLSPCACDLFAEVKEPHKRWTYPW